MTPTNDFFNMLEGVWENKLNNNWQLDWGWNFITQPDRNNPSLNDFKFRFDQMKETITFQKLGIARNIGISGEAGFWDGMAYDISIKNGNDEPIHHEMGHFLIQVIDSNHPDQQFRGQARIPVNPSGNELQGFIIRQASIPRANSFMTHGILHIGSLERMVDDGLSSFYSAVAVSHDPDFQLIINETINQEQENISSLNGPDLRSPLDWMLGFPGGDLEGIDWEFRFRDDPGDRNDDADMASGQRVINPVGIGKLLSDFWIGRRNMKGTTKEVLQYAQKVNIKFNDVNWPHVALNTLIKQ